MVLVTIKETILVRTNNKANVGNDNRELIFVE
jgi:hypothetical protein